MKIGIFSDRYLPQTDGISYSIEIFRRQLEAQGHEVYVFAPRPSWRYKERSQRIIRFSAVKGLFFDDWLTTFFFPPQAIAEIDKLGLDIVNFQTPSQVGLLGAHYALKRHLPLVTTYHTDLYQYVKHYPQVLPGILALALLARGIAGGSFEAYRKAFQVISPESSIEKWNQKLITRDLTVLHNACNLVITPSHKIERQLLSWKTTSRIVTLPTGVDRIPTTTREINAVRKKYALAPNDQIILLVCRLTKEKNIELLIRAFDLISRRLPKAKLLIIGPGDDTGHYQQLARTLPASDRVIFTGFIERSKLGAYYSLASVFAFPSLTDTQGMAVNEAVAAGLPVVMADREISEVVVNGKNGFYADPSPQDFATKLLSILTDSSLHEKLAHASLHLATQCSESSQAQRLIQLYEETINRMPAS